MICFFLPWGGKHNGVLALNALSSKPAFWSPQTDKLILHLPPSSKSKLEHTATRTLRKHTRVVPGDIRNVFRSPVVEIGEERPVKKIRPKRVIQYSSICLPFNSRQRERDVTDHVFPHPHMGFFWLKRAKMGFAFIKIIFWLNYFFLCKQDICFQFASSFTKLESYIVYYMVVLDSEKCFLFSGLKRKTRTRVTESVSRD